MLRTRNDGVRRPAYMNEKEMANLCGVTRRCLQRWRAAGRGPPFVRMGVMVKYLADEFDDWFNSQRGPK